jgi:hypothetical protein
MALLLRVPEQQRLLRTLPVRPELPERQQRGLNMERSMPSSALQQRRLRQ